MKTVHALIVVFILGFVTLGCDGEKKPSETYDPMMDIVWPSEPKDQSSPGNYTAILNMKLNKVPAMFMCIVQDCPKGSTNGSLTDKELLENFVFASAKFETNRRDIEIGPMKHHGVAIAYKKKDRAGEDLFERRLVVTAKGRIYDLSVSCSDNSQLSNNKIVSSFFESFTVKPK